MLHELLGISLQEKRVVTICGGGGKTSLMYALAREAKDIGETAVITTTNIFVPEEPDIDIVNPFAEEKVRSSWAQKRIVCSGIPIMEFNKLAAPEEYVQDWLLENCDGLYVEADGSKRLPLKYPAGWEPVPMKESTHVLVVAGLSAIGGNREAVVHRAALAESEIGYKEAYVTEKGMASLLWAGYGFLDPVFVLNQADTDELEQRGRYVAEELLSAGARRVVVLSLKNMSMDSLSNIKSYDIM